MNDSNKNLKPLNIDLSKVAALQQKRTLAFVNHFVITSVQFLNNFSRQCENKLMEFERKLEKVNASLVLLEAKLSSIPEIDIPQEESSVKTDEQTKIEQNESKIDSNESSENMPVTEQSHERLPEPRHPEYERFLKMIQVGVPLEAVKLKVSLEGLDPTILDEIVNKK